MTKLRVRRVAEADIRDFVTWRYEPPYDVYDVLGSDETAERMAAEVAYFLKPSVRCHSVLDGSGRVIAFCTFGQDGRVPGGDYSTPALDIGLGMRPELTGQGNGRYLVQAVVDFATATWQPLRLRVTIAEFNHRAQRVWRQAGFVQTQRFVATVWTKRPFLVYEKQLIL